MEQITQQSFDAIMGQRYLTTKDIQAAFMVNRRAAMSIKKRAIDRFGGRCPLNSRIVLKDSVLKAAESMREGRETQHGNRD